MPCLKENHKLLLAKTWEPKLTCVGCDGIPDLKGGNTLRSYSTLKLSMRIPPGIDKDAASKIIEDVLNKDPPYNAHVLCKVVASANGWSSPPLDHWLDESANRNSLLFFNKEYRAYGEGGTIPFMNMLGVQFPQAQFVITGLLGPKSNAHGPNEFLHIEYGKKLTCAVSHILYDYFSHK